MASRTRTRTPAPEPEIQPETTGNTYTPSEGGNVIAAAWQGLYNLFGARNESFIVTPEGITVTGMTVDEQYDISTIISDLFNRGDKTVSPRLDFLQLYPIVSGESPASFTNSDQITAWMVRYIKGGSRSPQYAKDANQRYKDANGLAVPRGRPRKIVRIDITSLDEAALSEATPEEIESLRATLENLSQAQAVVEA